MEEKDFEPAGLIPRSIIRTVERFRQQLRPETIALGIQEFRISRYQVRVSVRYFFILLLLPIAINWASKNVIIKPLVGYFWNTYGTSLFLNNYQAERAFKEMRDFESQLFFEMLLSNPRSCSELNLKESEERVHSTTTSIYSPLKKQNKIIADKEKQKKFLPDLSFVLAPHEDTKHNNQENKILLLGPLALDKTSTMQSKKNVKLNTSPDYTIIKEDSAQRKAIDKNFSSYDHRLMGGEPYDLNSLDRIDSNCFEVLFQEKTYLLAEIYNQQSITALSNMFGDCIMIISIILLLRLNAPQFTILKSFLIESFYSFNDAIKCFYIILITDFLVGFHSPRGWEIVMEILLRHLGLPENEEFILLFVGTFPVFLDTAFKYWIFRYLNKISPSTVATYHSMIE